MNIQTLLCIGEGSMGERQRIGILNAVSKEIPEFYDFDTTQNNCSQNCGSFIDQFDEFMESNNLYSIGFR